MNKHSIDYMHECIVNDFNDYENLVICRELVAQLSKRPQPQGMDYDTAENSYVDDLYTACGYNDFCLRELQMSNVALSREGGCTTTLPERRFFFLPYVRYNIFLSVQQTR